ncbi:MAG: hypothetical protein ACI91O_001526 [Candidatus Poriferisodalaceae bacterium]|jgi:hypothetical protein
MSQTNSTPDIHSNPVHLGLGATTVPQSTFTGDMEWFGARHAADGVEGRLVAMHTFSESWDSWEMHPLGTELVLCIERR